MMWPLIWFNKSVVTVNIMLQPYPQFKKNSLQCKLEQPKSKTKENINLSSKKKKKKKNINPSIAIDKN